MKKDIETGQELRDMNSALADMPRVMPYSVPNGYFEQFAEGVKKHCIPLWGQVMPHTVPAGYFENLSGQITARSTGNATSLPKEMPLQAPVGYFEQLPQQMLEKAKTADAPTKTRSISMPLRWAAAAIVILGIGITSYQALQQVQQPPAAENILASVPTNELQDYVQRNYRLDIVRIVTEDDISKLGIADQDIVKYLDETGWD